MSFSGITICRAILYGSAKKENAMKNKGNYIQYTIYNSAQRFVSGCFFNDRDPESLGTIFLAGTDRYSINSLLFL